MKHAGFTVLCKHVLKSRPK